MHAPQWLVADEPFQGLDSQRELTERERPLAGEAAASQPAEVL